MLYVFTRFLVELFMLHFRERELIRYTTHFQERNENMNEVTVYRTWDEPMADMAIDLLKSEGINAVRIADVPRNVLPCTMDGLGEIEVRVSVEDSEKALEILAVRFSEGEIESCEKETLESEDSDLSDDEDNN